MVSSVDSTGGRRRDRRCAALRCAAPRCAEVALAVPQRLRLCLHPSVHLLRSAYAVLSLWQWCQSPSDATPRVDEGDQVLLWRDGGDVSMVALDLSTFHCIEMLADGHDVAAAWVGARTLDHAFDLESCLRDLLGQGLIVAFTDEETAP